MKCSYCWSTNVSECRDTSSETIIVCNDCQKATRASTEIRNSQPNVVVNNINTLMGEGGKGLGMWHFFHFIATCLTGGLWLFVWAAHGLWHSGRKMLAFIVLAIPVIGFIVIVLGVLGFLGLIIFIES